jgi:hypothetical protein
LVQGQARGFGLAVDYDDGSVTLGALRFRNLRLLSTEADVALAPDLVRIGAVDGKISPLSLRADDVVIRDVAVTIVVDEDGSTSLDRVLAKLPPSEPDTTPLSQLAEALLPHGVSARARLENVTLTVIPRTPKAGERMQLTGLVASAELAGGKATARVGPSELRLVLGDKEAVAKLDAQVNVANRSPLTATLSVELVRQNLAPALPPVKKVVDLGAIVDFVPAEKRTRVRLERLALLDGAARIEATAEIPDDVAQGPVVRSASCRLDLVALARAVPAEYGPVTIEAEPITCGARDLELVPAPRGQLTLSGAIAKLAWRDLAVEGAKLDVSARPDGGALQAKVALAAESVKMEGLAVTGATVDVDAAGAKDGWPVALKGSVAAATVVTPGENVRDARVAFDGTLRGPKSLDLKAIIDAASVAAGGVATTKPHLEVTLAGFELAGDPVQSTGQVTVTGTVAQIVQPKGPRLDDVDLALDARLAGTAPSSARLRLNAKQLAIPGGGRDFPPAPLALTVDAPRLALAADPAMIRGEAKLDVTHGAASVAGTVGGGMVDATWDLAGKAARLGPARTVAFTSKGRYTGAIEQDTTVEVGRVATGDASLRGARIHLTSSGNARRHEATIAAALDEVVVGGKSVGSPKIDLVAALDRGARPHVELKLTGQTPDVDLRVVADIDEKRTVRWEAKGRAAKLASLAPLLPEGPSWKDVTVEIDGKGVASGVVKSVQDGVPVLVADPARTARGRQTLSLAVHDFHYQGAAETRADAGALAVRAVVDLGQPHKATIDVDAPKLSAVASGVHAQVEGLDINLVAEADRRGVGKADLTLRAKKIEQTAFAYYPVRDLELTAGVHGDPATALSIRAQLTNAGAGTKFELSGELDQRAEPGADAVVGRQSLALDGRIEQSLDALTGAPDRLRARGKVSVPFRVESGDLQLFQTSATLNLDGVSVELPADGIAVSDVNARCRWCRRSSSAPTAPRWWAAARAASTRRSASAISRRFSAARTSSRSAGCASARSATGRWRATRASTATWWRSISSSSPRWAARSPGRSWRWCAARTPASTSAARSPACGRPRATSGSTPARRSA